MLFIVIANAVKQSLTPVLSIDCRVADAPRNDTSLTFYEFVNIESSKSSSVFGTERAAGVERLISDDFLSLPTDYSPSRRSASAQSD